MTKQQRNWARQHDWYISWGMKAKSNTDRTLIYHVRVVERISGEKDSLRTFDSFEELARWAGY